MRGRFGQNIFRGQIKFMDSDGTEVCSYNPRDSGSGQRNTFDIPENAEIIGVYGYHGNTLSYFSSFGFILREKQ